MKRMLANVLRLTKKCFDTVLFCISKKPQVYTIDQTLDYIQLNHSSVSRFGDGEFLMILGHGNGFQPYAKALADRLKEVLNSNLDGHIVCISDIWGDLSFMKDQSIAFNRKYLRTHGYAVLKTIDCSRNYFNTFFTRPYDMFADKSQSVSWFEKNKQIWDSKRILIVEGEKSRLGVGNDLFDNASGVERMLCPSRNAFEKYDEILEGAMRYGKDRLILIALGMTATVLAYDLAQRGFWAVDIGHIDIEYEWFLKKADEKIKIGGKYTNEVAGGSVVDDDTIDLNAYEKEIVHQIL